MEILVTGARGFIGRHVVAEAMAQGHGVRALVRPGTESDLPPALDGARVIGHDLTVQPGLADALEGADAVIHCAAAMGGDAEHQNAVTVQGTTHLVTGMRAANVDRLVLLSSFAVYDSARLPAGGLLDESAPVVEDTRKRSPYVFAKRTQETLVREATAAFGWRSAILRPGIVYGPERTWFYHLGSRSNPDRWICYAGAGAFPLTYVENCADACVRALEAGTPGTAVTANIVDDDPPTRKAYMERLAAHEGLTPKIVDVPWGVLSSAAGLAGGVNALLLGKAPLPDLLRKERLHARAKPLRYANQHAKDVLGWAPQVGLEEGLKRSYQASDATESAT